MKYCIYNNDTLLSSSSFTGEEGSRIDLTDHSIFNIFHVFLTYVLVICFF